MNRSKNKYDVWLWVQKAAKSANTKQQKIAAAKLIRNFISQFEIASYNDHQLYWQCKYLQANLTK